MLIFTMSSIEKSSSMLLLGLFGSYPKAKAVKRILMAIIFWRLFKLNPWGPYLRRVWEL